ncbi:glycosyltransferase family 2 protein [Gimesia benthica]|uniref:Glycosyltransferase family 2 protein n=1 Tax=Gimesia benthica TaxID=2608982 RepID=A0A6I6A5W0_9PLAN|nr:glycosyltransferase family 2 protein [Gimesia benthica]QGQ21436.1 glycosyltransferase family 2 protein [Gimesia benthica]
MHRKALVALPVFNEERHVIEVLTEVRKYAEAILVVDDGSSDRTPELLKEVSGIEVLTHPENRGYGAALKSAFDYAIAHQDEYDILVTIDCDGQHEPTLLPNLVQQMREQPADGPIDMLSGSRYLKQFDGASIPPEDRRQINVAVTRRINEQLGFDLTDAFCGLKAYRVEALAKFNVTDLGYAMPLQLWVQAAAHGMKIVEFPVPLVYLEEERSFGGSLDDAIKRKAYYDEVLDREMQAAGLTCCASDCCNDRTDSFSE